MVLMALSKPGADGLVPEIGMEADDVMKMAGGHSDSFCRLLLSPVLQKEHTKASIWVACALVSPRHLG